MLTFIIQNTRERLQKKNSKKGLSITTSSTAGDIAVVSLNGKIDFEAAALLEVRIQELSKTGIKKLALDLSGVTGMDSTGLGEIIAIYNRFAADGGEVCVADLSDRIRLLFEYAKLHFVFRIFTNVASATEYLGKLGDGRL
jgi:anti-anti-sigma factor